MKSRKILHSSHCDAAVWQDFGVADKNQWLSNWNGNGNINKVNILAFKHVLANFFGFSA